MATYEATVASAWTPDQTFGYLADFSNAEQWDPGVLEGERLPDDSAASDGRVTTGSSFRLIVPFLGRKMTLVYRVVHISHENREVIFEAENSLMHARDRIVVRPGAPGAGAAVTYRADVHMRGVFSLVDPVLGRGFKSVGDRAVAGLTSKLSDLASAPHPAAGPADSGPADSPARPS